MNGSSMKLVRLKPQGPGPYLGPNRGPDRPVQKKFLERKFQSCKIVAKRRLDPSSRSATIFTVFEQVVQK